MGICMGAIFCAQFRTWFLSWLFFLVGHKIFRFFFILITTKRDQTNNARGKRIHEAQVEEEKRTFNKNRDLYASNTENFWLQEIANSWWYTHTQHKGHRIEEGRRKMNCLLFSLSLYLELGIICSGLAVSVLVPSFIFHYCYRLLFWSSNAFNTVIAVS